MEVGNSGSLHDITLLCSHVVYALDTKLEHSNCQFGFQLCQEHTFEATLFD
jgi:hypothetical protein